MGDIQAKLIHPLLDGLIVAAARLQAKASEAVCDRDFDRVPDLIRRIGSIGHDLRSDAEFYQIHLFR